MNYEDFITLIRERRTIRAYKSDPVDDKIINQIIEAGKWAPSGNNTQPFEIVVVKGISLVKQIETSLSQTSEPKWNEHSGAPVMLVVLGDPRFCEAYPKGPVREEILHSSLSAAIENMLLASTVLGLGGSVWKTVTPYGAIKIKELLEIPQFYIVKALLPLGYPKGNVTAPMKRDIEVHENRYDISKLKTDDEVAEIIKKYSKIRELNKFRVF